MVVAGEPSGDLLGAAVMRSAKQRVPSATFVGVGGPAMADEGLSSIVPFDDLSVMGVAEVLPRLRRLLGHLATVTQFARNEQPAVLLTIDSPGFSFRLAKRLRGTDMPKVHFVAPSVWAWRLGRAKAIAALYDHLLTLLPFEPPYFEREGLPATFVGHPALERVGVGDGTRFREQHGLSPSDTVFVVLPGSRRSETSRLLPVFTETIRRLLDKRPDLCLVVPTVSGVEQQVRAATAAWPANPIVVTGERARLDAFAAGSIALAASGTVALELAIAGVPMVVAYDANPITKMLAKFLVKTRFVNLANIMLGREVVPELLLERCRVEFLVPEMEALIASPDRQDKQRAAFRDVVAQLAGPAESPSAAAADVVLEVAGLQPASRS